MKYIITLLIVVVCSSQCAYSQYKYLDPTFGENGIAEGKALNGQEEGIAVVILRDGKILECCSSLSGKNCLILRRYDHDGKPDSTFGINSMKYYQSVDRVLSAKIVEYPDGKVLVVGQTYDMITFKSSYPFAFRVLSDGTPDSSFASAGLYQEVRGNKIEKFCSAFIHVDDGTITIVGGRGDSAKILPVITKLDRYGKRVSSFGNNGKRIVYTFADSIYINDADVNKYGDCVFGGSPRSIRTNDIYIVRSNSNGDLDSSFAEHGILRPVISDLSDRLACIKILHTREIFYVSEMTLNGAAAPFVLKLTPTGHDDRSFGDGGLSIYPMKPNGRNLNSFDVDSNGNVIVIGWGSIDGDTFATTFCFLNDGRVHPRFGQDGEIVMPAMEYANNNSIAVQADGKYLVAGWRWGFNQYSSIIQRIDPKAFSSLPLVVNNIYQLC